MNKVPTRASFALAMYFLFKTIPAGLAGLSIYLGYRLFILGVTGQASLSVESKTVSGQLLNAAPGLFFAVGGVVIIVSAIWRGVRIRLANDFDEAQATNA